MYVYAVEKVVDEENGTNEMQLIFDSEAKARAYIAELIAEEQKYDSDYNGRYYPWYCNSEDGLPIFTIDLCEVR